MDEKKQDVGSQKKGTETVSSSSSDETKAFPLTIDLIAENNSAPVACFVYFVPLTLMIIATAIASQNTGIVKDVYLDVKPVVDLTWKSGGNQHILDVVAMAQIYLATGATCLVVLTCITCASVSGTERFSGSKKLAYCALVAGFASLIVCIVFSITWWASAEVYPDVCYQNNANSSTVLCTKDFKKDGAFEINKEGCFTSDDKDAFILDKAEGIVTWIQFGNVELSGEVNGGMPIALSFVAQDSIKNKQCTEGRSTNRKNTKYTSERKFVNPEGKVVASNEDCCEADDNRFRTMVQFRLMEQNPSPTMTIFVFIFVLLCTAAAPAVLKSDIYGDTAEAEATASEETTTDDVVIAF